MRPFLLPRLATARVSIVLIVVGILSLFAAPLATAQSTSVGVEWEAPAQTNTDGRQAPVSCPPGFQLSDDLVAGQLTCFDHPVIVTTQEPVDCALGHLSPDKAYCFTAALFNTQAPISREEVIDAHVSPNAPTITCPVDYVLVSGQNLCVTTAGGEPPVVFGAGEPYCPDGSPVQPGDTCKVTNSGVITSPGDYQPGVAGTPGVPASCPAGTDPFVVKDGMCRVTGAPPLPEPCLANEILLLANFDNGHQRLVCYASQPQIPPVPETPAVPATCEGQTTTLPESECVIQTSSASVIPAMVDPDNVVEGCNAGSRLDPETGLCFAVTDPIVTPNPSTITCPSGYVGPTVDYTCTRTVLTAQPDQAVCKAGTLLETDEDLGFDADVEFVCLLDNAPTAPAPMTEPHCPVGDYHAKLDLCLVAAQVGVPPATPTPVATQLPTPPGIVPPVGPITATVPFIVTATGDQIDAPPTWVFLIESNCLDEVVDFHVLTAETFGGSSESEFPVETETPDGTPCTYTITNLPYLDWLTSLPAEGLTFTPLETGVPLLFIGVYQSGNTAETPTPVAPVPAIPTPALPAPTLPTPAAISTPAVLPPTPAETPGAVVPSPTPPPTPLPVVQSPVASAPVVAVTAAGTGVVTTPASSAPVTVGSVNFGGSTPSTPASMLGGAGSAAPAVSTPAAMPLAHTGSEARYLTVFGLALIMLGAILMLLSRRQVHPDPFA